MWKETENRSMEYSNLKSMFSFLIWSLTAQTKNQRRQTDEDKLKEEEDGVW